MPWFVSQEDSQQFIEIVIQGPTDAPQLGEVTSHCIRLSKAQGIFCFLINALDMEVLASPVKIYELPTRQYHEEGLNPDSKIALIRPQIERYHGIARFYENISNVRGWKVQTFDTRVQALDWLLENIAKPEGA